jgi:hypothetical protein
MTSDKRRSILAIDGHVHVCLSTTCMWSTDRPVAKKKHVRSLRTCALWTWHCHRPRLFKPSDKTILGIVKKIQGVEHHAIVGSSKPGHHDVPLLRVSQSAFGTAIRRLLMLFR